MFRLYASNLHELYLSDVAIALAAALGAALILFLTFGVTLKNFGAKAAILASAALVPGLFYVEIVDAVNWYVGMDLSLIAALPIILAIVAVIAVVVARSRIDLIPANAILNGIAFAIFIVPAWQVASHEWAAGGGSLVAAKVSSAHAAADASPVADPAGAKNTPDIYYLIFDRYGSQSTMVQQYGFDNGELIDFLKAKGFYIASDSHANYLKTAHSLASTFHMGYLDFLAEDQRSKVGDWHPIYDMLRNHRVGRFLKSNGYRFIQIGSWWGPTQYNPFADENYGFGFGEFDHRYLRKTIVRAVLDAVAPTSTYARRLQWEIGQCQRVPRQIEKVKEIGERNEKTFVFAHILVPHDPYVFGPDGHCLSYEEAKRRTARDGYVEQVHYANSLIKNFVSALLAREGVKPIIIIQADEGPFPERYGHSNRSWHEATVDELKMKMGILNAYYF
ncbi:MAG: sulfatase-like hydrolase/transferase, partial [Methyloceanibacter sp.]